MYTHLPDVSASVNLTLPDTHIHYHPEGLMVSSVCVMCARPRSVTSFGAHASLTIPACSHPWLTLPTAHSLPDRTSSPSDEHQRTRWSPAFGSLAYRGDLRGFLHLLDEQIPRQLGEEVALCSSVRLAEAVDHTRPRGVEGHQQEL